MEALELIFTQHYTDVVDTKYGSRTKNTFLTEDGDRYETWKAAIAAVLAASLDRVVKVLVDVKVTTKGENTYVNREIKEILGGSSDPVETPAPANQAGAEVEATPVKVDPATVSVAESKDTKEVRIMRQNAFNRAVEIGLAEGLSYVDDPVAFFNISDEILIYLTFGQAEDSN